MKIIIIIILLNLSVCGLYSQTVKDQELSNAEKFSAKAGTLIQKEFVDLGKVANAKIQVVYYTDLISSESVSSVRFEYEAAGSYTTDTKIASLDSDEIEGLIKSIQFMQDKVFVTTPTNYTEVTFISRGGFKAGCYWDSGKWSPYLKLEQYDSNSFVSIKKEDFTTILGLLEQAKTMFKK